MPAPGSQRFEFNDFSGGWSPSRHPGSLRSNEYPEFLNYVVGPHGEAMTRPPLRQSGSDLKLAEIYGLSIANGEATSGPWGLVVGNTGVTRTYLGFNSTSSAIPIDVTHLTAGEDPYPNLSIIRYKGIYYVNGYDIAGFFTYLDHMVRVDVDGAAQASFYAIDQSAPPTVVALAGGTLPDATYQCAVRLYNATTGDYGALSTPSPVTLGGGNNQINWSNVPIPAAGPGNVQATARQLFRTLPDQENEYYLVTTVNDMSTTSYSPDNVAVDSLGSRALPGFGSVNLTAITGQACMWRERMWIPSILGAAFGGQPALYYTEIGAIEESSLSSFLPVGPNDSFQIVAVTPCDEFLLVFKVGGIYRVTGTGPASYSVTPVKTTAGCSEPHAIAFGSSGVYFLGSDGYFYFTDGYAVRNISEQLGKLNLHGTSAGSSTLTNEIRSTIFPARNLFLTSVYNPTDKTCIVYAYDYVKNSWSHWTFPENDTDEVPKPRYWNLANNVADREARLYVAGQKISLSTEAWIMYLEDELYASDHNHTDEVPYEEASTVFLSPARALQTKNFDASDFGGKAGEAFIVNQVYLAIAWDQEILSASTDGFALDYTAYLLPNGNDSGSYIANTGTLSWSTESRANGQYHALGLSSQQQAVTSIALRLVSTPGASPRRHSIMRYCFDVTLVGRNYIQPAEFLRSNVVSP